LSESYADRVDRILKDIDTRVRREKKAEEIDQMIKKLSHINLMLPNAKWAYQFVSKITDESTFAGEYTSVKDSYQKLKDKFTKLKWKKISKIDIIEPSPFFNLLDVIIENCGKLENKIGKVLTDLKGEISASRRMAESLRIIPEIKINPQAFDDALSFLNRVGETTRDIANFVDENNDILSEKVEKWKELEKRMAVENKSLNLESIGESLGLSKATIAFLKSLRDEREAILASVTGLVVEEIKKKFPDLSKRLIISVEGGE
jgi:hypothetical protein